MRATSATRLPAGQVKYKVLKRKRSHRYGEASKVNEVVYFAAIAARNRFSIAYSGFKEAMNLRPVERLQLMEWLAQSLDKPDEKIDKAWP